jgi:spermidine synthase
MALPWKFVAEWVSEGEACVREAKRILVHRRTRFQEFMVAELAGLGMSLVIDGKVQSSLLDEHWYHEALVHPVLLAHPCPRRVLVVGGGEGATAREVLRHRCVERVVMVDIDEELVNVAKELLAEWHRGAFEDGRLELVIGDGRRFVEEHPGEFDAVILDVVDPTEGGPAALLYTREFYEAVKRALRDRNGVVVAQATSPSLTPTVYATIARTMASVFNVVRPYITYVRSYNGLWGFVAASDGPDPARLEDVDRLLKERVEGELRFYDSETHRWMFSLPKPVREGLSRGRVATDEEPIVVPV